MRLAPRRRPLPGFLVALACCIIAIVGCARSEPTAVAREDELVIFAAASLRNGFATLGKEFERAHPGVAITFSFAGTQELRTQLEHGAVADVFASADQRHMDELLRAGRVANPTVFARNEPVIVVSSEGARTVKALADLPNAARIVVGLPDVPIGRYTLEILERAQAALGPDFRARVEAKVASRELNVRQVLTKVSLGEADAAIVYRTDARSARNSVTVAEIPPESNVVAEYPIAVVTGAPHPGLARAWVDFVLSSAGRRALESAGFTPPVGSSASR
nr:MAG: molybdate ABC transporter substrate-binding protein [Pseudomonadota bacterium]